jgi:hypothetical protein
MSKFGFGPEMIDFRTVLAATVLSGCTLLGALAFEILARSRRVSNSKALPHAESPKVADNVTTESQVGREVRSPLRAQDTLSLQPLR